MQGDVKILIVEDEFMISEDIAMRLEDFGYNVISCASNAKEALSILNEKDVDLALLDVNIDGEIDGIELSKIITEKYNIPFIFLTSLASKTIVERAKECNPSAYLLKPFNDRQVQIAIEIALENFAEEISPKKVETPNNISFPHNAVISIKDSLFLKKDKHFERVRLQNITFVSAESNYATIHTETEKYLYSGVLKKIENKLPKKNFIRVHRSYIVNIDYITAFEGNDLYLGEKIIPLSKKYKDHFFKLLIVR